MAWFTECLLLLMTQWRYANVFSLIRNKFPTAWPTTSMIYHVKESVLNSQGRMFLYLFLLMFSCLRPSFLSRRFCPSCFCNLYTHHTAKHINGVTSLLLALLSSSSRLINSHSRAPNIFAGLLWGEHFRIFIFEIMHSGVLNIFEQQQGPPTAGAPNCRRVTPLTLLSLNGPVIIFKVGNYVFS